MTDMQARRGPGRPRREVEEGVLQATTAHPLEPTYIDPRQISDRTHNLRAAVIELTNIVQSVTARTGMQTADVVNGLRQCRALLDADES